MKKCLGVLIIGFILCLLLLFCGCDFGNNKKQEFETKETTVDFSLYSNHGSFGDDGITWVEKSDYTGVKYGYIDRDGNFIIPLTSEIVYAKNFYKGFAIIWYTHDNMWNGDCAIINTKGEVVATFEKHAACDLITLNNGNIYLETGGSEASMFCVSTCEFVSVPLARYWTDVSLGYHEGLLLIDGRYSNYDDEEGVRYIDENGEVVLHLEKSNQYYRKIKGASVFENGKATVFFLGQNLELYKVTIDKTGKWLDEPVSAWDDEVYWGKR